MVSFFKTALKIEFEESTLDDIRFNEEFISLNSNAQIMRFKKLAQKIELSESEELLFNMLISVKESITRLELKDKEFLITLQNKAHISGVHYENLEFLDTNLVQNQVYYARLKINNKEIAFFIKALDEKTASIIKIKSEDKALYDAFVAQTQRELIKEMKGKENE
ncbi:hypothetical protein [Campylobacter sp. MIT 97-5078]|uniref:hypothetical protein n=1 Tax=Campylobacter sp. MIT 97-5078 TaxID=1548153 RepID=UPI00068BAC2B|nr:hypothetical protein [Campylobacter sp. MIT 97-5078]TQR27847.1 hypothetical protein DMB91_02800 [Campylobacter sp. MIT 97-5078]